MTNAVDQPFYTLSGTDFTPDNKGGNKKIAISSSDPNYVYYVTVGAFDGNGDGYYEGSCIGIVWQSIGRWYNMDRNWERN